MTLFYRNKLLRQAKSEIGLLEEKLNTCKCNNETLCNEIENLKTGISYLTKEIHKCKFALSDAIRRPMGIIPHSAEGLISVDEVIKAEKRREKEEEKENNEK